MGLLDDALGAAKGALLQGAEGGAQGILNNVLPRLVGWRAVRGAGPA